MHRLLRCLIFIQLIFMTFPSFSVADYAKGLEAVSKGNFKAAFGEWEPLARKGDSRAQYYLGWLYQNGKGVQKNYDTAVSWYDKAARNGNEQAQYALGWIYANGKVGKKNLSIAYMWFLIAERNGDVIAQIEQSALSKKMTKSEIFEAKGLAKRCIQTKYQQCINKIKNSNKTKNITRKPQPKKKAFGKSLSNKKAVKKPKIEQKIVSKSQNTARKIPPKEIKLCENWAEFKDKLSNKTIKLTDKLLTYEMIAKFSSRTDKFDAYIKHPIYGNGTCEGFINNEGVISSKKCTLGILKPTKLSGTFPSIIFNEDNLCLNIGSRYHPECDFVSFTYKNTRICPIKPSNESVKQQPRTKKQKHWRALVINYFDGVNKGTRLQLKFSHDGSRYHAALEIFGFGVEKCEGGVRSDGLLEPTVCGPGELLNGLLSGHVLHPRFNDNGECLTGDTQNCTFDSQVIFDADAKGAALLPMVHIAEPSSKETVSESFPTKNKYPNENEVPTKGKPFKFLTPFPTKTVPLKKALPSWNDNRE